MLSAKNIQEQSKEQRYYFFFQVAPFNVIMFSVYEACKHGCVTYNGYRHRAAESHYTGQDIDDTDYFDEDIYHEKPLLGMSDDEEH